MERVEGEAKSRFDFYEEIMKLSDKMSWHSLVCTVTRMKKIVDRVEEEEKMVDRRLEEVQRQWKNMMGRKTSMVGQISGWKEMKDSCGQMVGEVAGMSEMARGRVAQLKGTLA
jgi:hypothetical protein